MALGINILSSFDGTGLKKAIAEFNKLETVGQKAQFAVQKAALPAAAALAGLGFAAVKASQAAMQEQKEMELLAFTLQRVTGASKETVDANEEFIAGLQRTTLFSDGELRPALASLVQTSGDLAKSQKDIQLAMDISVATGVPLIAVTDALGKAFNGNFKSLKALSPALNDNIKEGQGLDQIFGELNKTFGGATAAATDTAAGRMKQLQNQMSDLQESIGASLLPIVEKIVPVFSALASFAEKNQSVFLGLAGAVAFFSAAILLSAAYLKLHALAALVAAAATKAFGHALTASGVGAFVVLLGLAIGATIALANALFGDDSPTEGVKQLNYQMAGSDGIVRNAAGSFIYLTGEAKKLNESLSRTVNLLDTQNRRLEGLAGMYGITTFKTGQFNEKTGGAAKVVETAQEKLEKFTAALKGNYDAQRSLTSAQRATTSANTSLKDAIDSTAKAQDHFNKVSKGYAENSKEAISATNNLASSQKKLRDANNALGSAQLSVVKAAKELEKVRSVAPDPEKIAAATRRIRDANLQQRDAVLAVADAEKKLADLRSKTADPADVAEAERNLERSKFSVEEANFAVIDAEKELATLRADPKASAIDIRRAEINLSEAKLAVSDAIKGISDAEKDLLEQQNQAATPDEIADAERDLERSKLQVGDATDRVKEAELELAKERAIAPKAEDIAEAERDLADARIQVTDATDNLRDANIENMAAQLLLNRILEGAGEETDAYKDALKLLNDAKKDEETARYAVADAILAEAEATLALAEAIKKLNKVTGTTPAGIVRRGTEQLAGISTANPALSMLNNSNGASMTTTNLNMTVNAGMGTDGDVVARQIIDVLKSYERANGFIPITSEFAVAV